MERVEGVRVIRQGTPLKVTFPESLVRMLFSELVTGETKLAFSNGSISVGMQNCMF